MLEELINIEEAIYQFPLSLKTLKNDILINQINNFLPYSIGIEIECNQLKCFNISKFKSIANILDVNCDNNEQRFRIPSGIKGMICLFEICKNLQLYSELNLGSGIHYHVDMTKTYDLLDTNIIDNNSEWILNELDNWNYKGTYNKRVCEFNTNSNWVRFQSCFKTAEFRIGEMSFDYKVLIKRIIHISEIISKLNETITKTPIELKLKSMKDRLEELSNLQNNFNLPPQNIIQDIINKRIIKINNGKK